jgi:ABC-type bacteriocin/lantibiotic exporter with double-glycine peptidase domain
MEAAKTVGAHDFIKRLPGGYDSVLHERGQNLSLGQRQLIAFARAVIAQPRILILDEATANVDTRTEVVIQRALKRLLKGRTSFVIAHRLSTVRGADTRRCRRTAMVRTLTQCRRLSRRAASRTSQAPNKPIGRSRFCYTIAYSKNRGAHSK